MVTISLPDGARRELSDGATGATVAESIAKSLAKKAVAMKVNGALADLADPVPDGAQIAIVTRDDPAALELIRHDCAHVLAEAVQELFPGTQVTIGPVIENGFYYDFFRNEPFSTEDFAAIEAKMREIIARNLPFTKEVWERDRARDVFETKGRDVQGRAGRRHSRGPGRKDLFPGRLVRPLPRPAHALHRPNRRAPSS